MVNKLRKMLGDKNAPAEVKSASGGSATMLRATTLSHKQLPSFAIPANGTLSQKH